LSSPLLKLSANQLYELAAGLRNRTIQLHAGDFVVAPHVPHGHAGAVAEELLRRKHDGMTADHVADLLWLLAEQRMLVEREHAKLDLVWTGPEGIGSASRDTRVVVKELFGKAKSNVLLSTYAIYDGAAFFKPLADRMVEQPRLTVELFVNIDRKAHQSAEQAVEKFTSDFTKYHWPWPQKPRVFYDPRAHDLAQTSVLHAKCVIVDGATALISSANFTEAASNRNIEAGVLTTDRTLIATLASQFRRLVVSGELVEVKGW